MTDPLLLPAFLGALCASAAMTATFLSGESFPAMCFGTVLLILSGYVLMGIA